jgi:hypothetical protein
MSAVKVMFRWSRLWACGHSSKRGFAGVGDGTASHGVMFLSRLLGQRDRERVTCDIFGVWHVRHTST